MTPPSRPASDEHRPDPVRVAVVGVGAMGRRHARVFASLAPRFALVGVADTRADAAAEAARAHEAEVLDGLAAAIARADLVVLATPIPHHAGAALAAVRAGRHVLVEKPICARASEAHALVAAAARAERQVFVGHSERFNPVVRVLARLLRGDPPIAMELRRAGRQAVVDARDAGVLVNLGVHDLDLAAHLGGGPVRLVEAIGAVLTEGGSEDLAHALLETSSGAPVHVHVDRTAPARHRSIAIATRDWIYEGDLLAPRLVRTARASGARAEVPLPADEPLVAQAVAVGDALAGRASDVARGHDGVAALSLAERAGARIRAAARRTALELDAVGE